MSTSSLTAESLKLEFKKHLYNSTGVDADLLFLEDYWIEYAEWLESLIIEKESI